MSIIRGSNIAASPTCSPCACTTAVSFPAGTQAGDLALLFTAGFAYPVTMPAGWTILYAGGNITWTGSSAWKFLTSADIAAGSVTVGYTPAFGSCFDQSVGVVTFVGNYAIRQYQGCDGSCSTLTMSGAVQPTDVAIYWGSGRSATSFTITPEFGTATVLQTGVTAGAYSVLSLQEPLPGGTMGVDYVETPPANVFNVQVIVENPGGIQPLEYLCDGLGAAVTGTPYLGTISVTGGVPPYCISIVDPADNPLPPGLIFSVFVNDGEIKITGIPTKPGTYTFTLNITDTAGSTICATCTITVTGSDLSCPCGPLSGMKLYVQACYSQPPSAEAGAVIEYGFPLNLNAYYGFNGGAPPNLTVVNQLLGIMNCSVDPTVCSTLTMTAGSYDCHGNLCDVIGFSEIFECDLTTLITDPTSAFYNNINGLLAILGVGAVNTGFLFWSGLFPSTCTVCDLEVYDIFVAMEFVGGLFISRPRTVNTSNGSGKPVGQATGGQLGGGGVPYNGGALEVTGTCGTPNTFCTSANISLLQWGKGGLIFPAYATWTDFYQLSGYPSPCPDCNFTPPPTLTANCPSSSQGLLGAPFLAQIAVTGGNGPYIVDVHSGNFPPGLTIVNTTISGTPLAPGSYTFTLEIFDSSSPMQEFTLTCNISISGVASQLPSSPFSSSTGQFRAFRRLGPAPKLLYNYLTSNRIIP